MSKTAAAGTEDIRSNNVFIRKNENTRKTGARMTRNTRSDNRMNDTKRNDEYFGKDRHHRIGKEPANSSMNFGVEMFPELKKETPNSSTYVSNTLPVQTTTSSSWLDTIKQREEDEKNNMVGINVNDRRYWNGVHWIGPMFMRAKINSKSNNPTISKDSLDSTDTLNNKTDDLILQPCPQVFNISQHTENIEYSKDSVNWYGSWNETFSDEQLENIRLDEEQNEKMEIFKIMEDYRCKVEYESDKYYKDTGELSDYAKAVYEREEYERYVEQLDIQYYEDDNEESNDMVDGYDYLEEDEEDVY